MTPDLADALRAFAQVTHVYLTRAETAEHELASERQHSAKLALNLRCARDRLAEHEQLRAGQAADLKALQGALATRPRPAPVGGRGHHGPPGRCNCGVVHGHQQAIALNATASPRQRTGPAT